MKKKKEKRKATNGRQTALDKMRYSTAPQLTRRILSSSNGHRRARAAYGPFTLRVAVALEKGCTSEWVQLRKTAKDDYIAFHSTNRPCPFSQAAQRLLVIREAYRACLWVGASFEWSTGDTRPQTGHMMPRCILGRTDMQKQQAACHRLLSAFFFPLSSSHPGSLAVDLVYVSCSAAMSPSRGWSNVPTSTCILVHGNSAPISSYQTMLLRHHGIGRRNAKARPTAAGRREYSLIISCALINHIGGVTHPRPQRPCPAATSKVTEVS